MLSESVEWGVVLIYSFIIWPFLGLLSVTKVCAIKINVLLLPCGVNPASTEQIYFWN